MAINRLVEKSKVEVYANTLFADTSNTPEEVAGIRNQLKEIISLIYADMELNFALSDPDYTPEQRHKLAQSVFAQAHPVLREVLAVMAENEDMDKLSRVYHYFEKLMADKLNLCVVDVVTAVGLDDALRNQIKEKTESDLGHKAMLNESIDKSILGGIIMSVNGMRIDASVVSQLNKARHTLKANDGGES